MKANAKEILRWIAIAASGGFAGWNSISSLYHMATRFDADSVGLIFPFCFLVLFTAPFYIVAYICFRRRYRELFTVLGVVGAVVVFGVLMTLPHRLHVFDFFVGHEQDLPWVAVLGLPVSLICLFGPFYAAAWVLRLCRRLAQRPSIRSSELPPAGAAGSRSP